MNVSLRGMVAVPLVEMRMQYISVVSEIWMLVAMMGRGMGGSGSRSRRGIFGGRCGE
jgi:hypothetical protein